MSETGSISVSELNLLIAEFFIGIISYDTHLLIYTCLLKRYGENHASEASLYAVK